MNLFDLFAFGFSCVATGMLSVFAVEYGHLSPLIWLLPILTALAVVAFWAGFVRDSS